MIKIIEQAIKGMLILPLLVLGVVAYVFTWKDEVAEAYINLIEEIWFA